MSFNDFVQKCNLKNKATSKIKIQQVFSSFSVNVVGVYSRDGPFKSDVGIVNLHPFQGTRWVIYTHECFFDSQGCSTPQKFSKFTIKRNGHCLFSEYKTEGLTNEQDSYYASYCLYLICLTKVWGKNFCICCFEFLPSIIFFNKNDITRNNIS